MPKKPEAFFEVGQRSRCIFTTSEWCDHFHYQLPSAAVDFLCDIVTQTTGIILPSATQNEENALENLGLIDRAKLRQMLVSYFNDTELRNLCFDLEVDYEALKGDSKDDKARELLAYLDRREHIDALVHACRAQRPNVPWPEIIPKTVPDQVLSGNSWDQIYEQVAHVWGDRRVGFQCYRASAEAWTAPRPCEDCELVRRAHVVVLDLNGGDQRASVFLQMATASVAALQMIQSAITEPLPAKQVILINRGKANILRPSDMAMFQYLDYAPAGNPDYRSLGRWMSEQAQIASAQLFDDEATPIVIAEEDESAEADPLLSLQLEPEPQTTAPQPTTADWEGNIRILDTATVPRLPPEPEMPIAVVRQQLMNRDNRLRHFLQFLDQQGQTGLEGDLLSKAERAMLVEDYTRAIRLFHQATSGIAGQEVQPYSIQQYVELCLKICVEKLHFQDIVRVFFETVDLKDLKNRLSLSELQTGKFHSARVEIKDPSLWEHLDKVSQVPLRVYDELTAHEIGEWYKEMVASQDRVAFVVAATTVDRAEIGLQRIKCRDELKPPVHFVELQIDDLKRFLISGLGGFGYVRDQIDAISGRLADPYIENKPVSKDDEFFGRHEIVRQLVERIHHEGNFLIFGHKRSGKSSLLLRLRELTDMKDHLAVGVKFTQANMAAGYRAIADRVKEELQLRYPEDKFSRNDCPALDLSALPLFQLDEKATRSQWEATFVSDLGNLFRRVTDTKQLGCQRVILLLDEFDTLLKLEPDDYWGMISQLCELGYPQYPVVLGIASYGPFMLEQQNRNSPAYQRFHELPMGMLTYEECKELVEEIGERYLLYYDTDSLKAIYGTTGGDPFVTRLLCNQIFHHLGKKGGIVHLAHVEPCVRQYVDLETRRRHIKNIAKFLEDNFKDEASILLQIALNTSPDETISLGRLRQAFADRGWGTGQFQDALGNLRQLEMIQDASTTDEYRIRMGLLHRVLREEQMGRSR